MGFNSTNRKSSPRQTSSSVQGKPLLPDLLDNVQWQSPYKKYRPAQDEHISCHPPDNELALRHHQTTLQRYLETVHISLAALSDNKRDGVGLSAVAPVGAGGQPGHNQSDNLCIRRNGGPLRTQAVERSNSTGGGGGGGDDPSIFMSMKPAVPTTGMVPRRAAGQAGLEEREMGCQWRENVDIFEPCNMQEEPPPSSFCRERQAMENFGDTSPLPILNETDFQQNSGCKLYPWPENCFPIESKDIQLMALAASMSSKPREPEAPSRRVSPEKESDPNVLREGHGSQPESSGSTFHRIPAVVGTRYWDCSQTGQLLQQLQPPPAPRELFEPTAAAAAGVHSNPRVTQPPSSSQRKGGVGGRWATDYAKSNESQSNAPWNSSKLMTLECLMNILKQHESMLVDWENLDYKIRQFQWAMTELYQSKEVLHFKIEAVSLLIHSTISSLKKVIYEQSMQQQNLPSSSSTTTTASSGIHAARDPLLENSETDEKEDQLLCVERYLLDRYSCEENFTEEEEEDSCRSSQPCCECSSKFSCTKFRRPKRSLSALNEGEEEEDGVSVLTRAASSAEHPVPSYSEDDNDDNDDDHHHHDSDGDSVLTASFAADVNENDDDDVLEDGHRMSCEEEEEDRIESFGTSEDK